MHRVTQIHNLCHSAGEQQQACDCFLVQNSEQQKCKDDEGDEEVYKFRMILWTLQSTVGTSDDLMSNITLNHTSSSRKSSEHLVRSDASEKL